MKEPRKVLESILGLESVEMERNRESSLCCGRGGGRFWTETVAVGRFSNSRLREATDTGPEVLVKGCPFCMLNFEDSAKVMESGDSILLQDISETVTFSLCDIGSLDSGVHGRLTQRVIGHLSI